MAIKGTWKESVLATLVMMLLPFLLTIPSMLSSITLVNREPDFYVKETNDVLKRFVEEEKAHVLVPGALAFTILQRNPANALHRRAHLTEAETAFNELVGASCASDSHLYFSAAQGLARYRATHERLRGSTTAVQQRAFVNLRDTQLFTKADKKMLKARRALREVEPGVVYAYVNMSSCVQHPIERADPTRSPPERFSLAKFGNSLPIYTYVLPFIPEGETWKIFMTYDLAFGAKGRGRTAPPYCGVEMVIHVERVGGSRVPLAACRAELAQVLGYDPYTARPAATA